ncbi:MAG TPA: hypothetical protein VGN00_21225 [Puia sp.]|jgi:hypothetical protein
MNRRVLLIFLLLGVMPALNAQKAGNGASDHIGRFVAKYRLKRQDVTIVLLDGSVSTDMGYASKRPDAAYRPPCFTEYNIPSFIEERLRWKEQQFRRYDAKRELNDSTPVFSESEGGLTAQYDSAWDWQNKPPVSNGYNGLTRILSGPAPRVAYLFPESARRCDLIYRTDYLSSAALEVSVQGGKGAVQVYDEWSASWRDADGFVFSAREKDQLIPGSFFPGKPFGATTLRKSIYQKRLKMRCMAVHEAVRISITSRDGGRLCYWGITYSPKEYMLQFINSARGGHDIGHLTVFEPWSVDYWKPDLILYSCNTINEGADASSANTSNSPKQFADRFEAYIRKLLNKPYSPEVFAYILFTAKAHGLINEQDVVGTTFIPKYGEASVFDFIDALHQRLQLLPIASANAFYHYWDTGRQQAARDHQSIFSELFGDGGPKGKGYVADFTHLNDHGALVGWEYLSAYFDF